MPEYEFECQICMKIFSVKLSIDKYNELSNIRCPFCRTERLNRKYTQQIIFKGPGFYSTDNRKRET